MGKTYYVATTGNDNNPGTLSQPWATWQKGFLTAMAGDTVYFRGGVYQPTQTYDNGNNICILARHVDGQWNGASIGNSGTYENPICFYNYPGETPILDCSKVHTPGHYLVGIMIYWSEHLRFRGLTIRNVFQRNINVDRVSGINTWGASNLHFENMTIYNISGTAIYSLGSCGKFGILTDTVRFINNDLHDLCDTFNIETPGNFGDGFKTDNEKGAFYEFRGNRIWNYSDDGIDASGSAVRIINGNWAFNAGSQGMGIDGNGFKFPGPRDSINYPANVVTNNLAAFCSGSGFFDMDYYIGPGLLKRSNSRIYNNTAYKTLFGFVNGDNPNYPYYFPTKYRNNIAYDVRKNGINDLGRYYHYDEHHNTWDPTPNNGAPFNIYTDTVTVTDDDFILTGSKEADSLEAISQLTAARQPDNSLPNITFLHLAEGSDLTDAGIDVGLPYSGSAPDIGAFEKNVVAAPAIPVYVSSAIANATPSVLEMTYNTSLANIVPAASAFTVMVNSAARTVSSVSVSGTKVSLTLSSPVAYGNVVTVAYTKPATNPLQTASGGQAASITAQPVTNNVAAPAIPVYVSSAIANATPSVLEMTYNTSLANIVPAASAFTVMVNSAARTVSSVSVSGTKVSLTLSSPVVYGNVVTVAYTKPATNPLQTASGGQAASITAQPVTNNVAAPVIPVYVSSAIANATPSVLEMTYNTSLANIVPAASAFTVMVNSTARTVSSVSVSGTQVSLTLSSPMVYGNVVTVAYTKPAINPLQTTAGGQAASLSAQPVNNNCVPSSNQLPNVSIYSPGNNSVFKAPGQIEIAANASDIDGTIVKVEFFNGNNKLGEKTTAPYVITWADVPVGRYLITAVATDNLYSEAVSSPVTVTVKSKFRNTKGAPVISFIEPRNGDLLAASTKVDVNVDSFDPDTIINKLEYFIGDTKIGESHQAPYTISFVSPNSGSYRITSNAYDELDEILCSSFVDVLTETDSGSEAIKLYPNPNDGHFSVESLIPLQDERDIVNIINSAGKAVYQGRWSRDEKTRQFDISHLDRGLYILIIKNQEVLFTKKFVKN